MEAETKLYLCVIIQAIEDIISLNPVATTPGESRRAKPEARQWFLNNSKDYQMICESANVKPFILRKKILNAKPPYTELLELLNEYRKFS